MSKMPFMKFYPADFLIDTQRLTMEEKGIWMTLICHIWINSNNGTVEMDGSELASIIGGRNEVIAAFMHLMKTGVGDISEIKCDGKSTLFRIHSRRIERDKKELRMNAFYVSKHRCKDTSKTNVMVQKSEVRSQKSDKDKDSIEATPQTDKPMTDIQRVVTGFKMIQGYDKDDKQWDRLNFKRYTSSAKQLLDFLGSWKSAVDCAQDIYEKFTARGLTVTLETVCKHAAEWKKDHQEMEAKNGILSI